MRVDELVEVEAVQGHADDRAATGWRHVGETYLTTMGVARRRMRANLVELVEDELEESEPAESETEQDEDEDEEDSEGDEAPEEHKDEEQEDVEYQ